MSTAIALLCNFYSWTFDYALSLTLRQYNKAFDEMTRIRNIEAGVKEEIPMGGELGAKMAERLLPSKEMMYGKTR